VRKEEDFSEWYNAAIDRANLTDKRYPVKGMNVWTAYGFAVMRRMDELIRSEMARTGHDEVSFPLLIPESEFQKEAQHIKGFSEEVYWVTTAGGNPLDVRLCLRPTSEAAMYPMFALWIRSHADLPLKTFQIVSTYRYDTKQTRAFMRVREIHFFEAHTCHESYEGAEAQVHQDLEIMGNLARRFGVPYLLNRRPEWDKFPGAHYSLACDSVMPTGRTLQVGTIHHYRDNFARAYDVKYETTLEGYVAELYRRRGYRVTRQAGPKPGIDLVLERDAERIRVEVKDKVVGPTELRDLLAELGDTSGAPSGSTLLVAVDVTDSARALLRASNVQAKTVPELNALAREVGMAEFSRHTYVHQTTYGMSERLLGAVVALHGDDRGFTLPPAIAPIQVVIVPILAKGDQERILREARALAGEIGWRCRTHVDDRDRRPGEKFYEWEAKGVPVRAELGPRDIEQGVVTAVRRDTGQKTAVTRGDAANALGALLDAIQEHLHEHAQQAAREATARLQRLEPASEGVHTFLWCEAEACARQVEEKTELKILGTPFPEQPVQGPCLVCGSPATAEARAARTY
jgi:prolyl-tRNA synthetase